MASVPVKRRLAAIMATDVVGYARLMESDEEATLALIKALQADVIAPNIERNGGRIFKLIGDGTLSVFDSATGAVECAMAIQGELVRSEPGARMVLRIGINLADVLVDGTDMFGDGVNVASRVEAGAVPGGISITDGVYHQIAARIGGEFVEGGEKRLKNIERPVRVWHWQPPHTGTMKAEPSRIAGSAASLDREKVLVRVGVASSALPHQQEVMGLITSGLEQFLSERHWIDVASASAAEMGSRSHDYTVSIGIHGAGPFRLNVRFLRTSATSILWSRAFDLPADCDIDAIESVAAGIVSLVVDKVLSAASTTIARKSEASWSAYEYFLYGRMLDAKHLLPDAERFFQKATELDPTLIDAHAMYALALTYSFSMEGVIERLRRAEDISRIGLQLDNNHAFSHYAAASVQLVMRNYDGAESHYVKARDLAPGDIEIRADHAEMLHYVGDLETAATEIEECFRKAKYPPVWFWAVRGIIRFQQGRADDAVEDFENIPKKSWRSLILLAAAHALRGDEVRRRHNEVEARSLQPRLSPELVQRTFPYRNEGALAKLLGAFGAVA
ncbi:class 3 adenylate cyclase/tetratricopeptide (TPR) repeat protein [Rhizobium pisi]|uniref:Adenylate/guanylate cyclase domain-containing protein n=1 Tax=Rhizobium pisi TaxID=574561 RepID=A0A3R9AYQ6_9HYPH|nr:adenylate/guanylate cyclase domain-containing protein [Rhizobium pisi]MBB3133541.1 class 3 adenylate cyclase/tetratricopeptide (TPR) repeat protein [Rhizobium pisi]RSB82074.1 adenylate/guanylate cyclase domain-containing protein [Rhizobium pisi]TCA44937.1 adenylate/guanylate cyclase domain-containing protein [Rhizobium pisi]